MQGLPGAEPPQPSSLWDWATLTLLTKGPMSPWSFFLWGLSHPDLTCCGPWGHHSPSLQEAMRPLQLLPPCRLHLRFQCLWMTAKPVFRLLMQNCWYPALSVLQRTDNLKLSKKSENLLVSVNSVPALLKMLPPDLRRLSLFIVNILKIQLTRPSVIQM